MSDLRETIAMLRKARNFSAALQSPATTVLLDDLAALLDAADLLCRLEQIAEEDAYITVGGALHLAEERQARERRESVERDMRKDGGNGS